MEEEWRTYLKENASELYEQMRESINHIFNWRYNQGRKDGMETAAKKRVPKCRVLPPVGRGVLHAEQNYCFEKGYKEGVSALRKAIREAAKNPKGENK